MTPPGAAAAAAAAAAKPNGAHDGAPPTAISASGADKAAAAEAVVAAVGLIAALCTGSARTKLELLPFAKPLCAALGTHVTSKSVSLAEQVRGDAAGVTLMAAHHDADDAHHDADGHSGPLKSASQVPLMAAECL